MFYVLICILISIAIALFYFAFSYILRKSEKAKIARKKKSLSHNPNSKKCIVCNSVLHPNEKLISKVYPTSNGTDQRCIINGCPHCQPYCLDGAKRKCPVCGKSIPIDGYLIARMFFKPHGKNHVHVVGCTECHKKI